jgi:FtsZ-binding cell division protein ZapB
MKHAELIERLKDADAEEVMTTPLLEQAADAIESLQAEVERLTLACNKAAQAELDLLAERDALKLDAERLQRVTLVLSEGWTSLPPRLANQINEAMKGAAV